MYRFFRINSLKAKNEEEVLEELKNEGFEVEKIDLFGKNFGFFFKGKEEKTKLSESKLFFDKKIYIQSASSQAIPLILSPQKSQKILDLAASPGSKTTQIASILENTGLIFANDPKSLRFKKLVENLEDFGVNNCIPTAIYGEIFHEFLPNFFDKVLVDPSCTSIGADKKLEKKWYPKKSKILATNQLRLLKSGFLALKNGGEIVYSTCTDRIIENELVIERFLREFSNKCELLDIKKSFRTEKNCEYFQNKDSVLDRSFDKEKISSEIWEKTSRIKFDENFFVAKFRKTSGTFQKKKRVLNLKIYKFKEEENFVRFFVNNKFVRIEKNLFDELVERIKFERL